MTKERFEDIIERLERVVQRLEGGDLPLEESLSVFKEGVDLVKRGNARLNDMEQRIEILMGEIGEDGKERTQPFVKITDKESPDEETESDDDSPF